MTNKNRIICYCSDITEHEIITAINKNHTTISQIRNFLNKNITGNCNIKNPEKKCCHSEFEQIINHYKSIKMNKTEIALNYFNNKFNCSQAVLTSFCKELNINEDVSLKIACAFGGGMGRQQHTCGAVTGALMVLGLKYGKALNDDEQKKNDTYNKAAFFLKEFEKRNGSTICKILLQNLDMNNEKDLAKINELNLFQINCEKYIADAVEIVQNI